MSKLYYTLYSLKSFLFIIVFFSVSPHLYSADQEDGSCKQSAPSFCLCSVDSNGQEVVFHSQLLPEEVRGQLEKGYGQISYLEISTNEDEISPYSCMYKKASPPSVNLGIQSKPSQDQKYTLLTKIGEQSLTDEQVQEIIYNQSILDQQRSVATFSCGEYIPDFCACDSQTRLPSTEAPDNSFKEVTYSIQSIDGNYPVDSLAGDKTCFSNKVGIPNEGTYSSNSSSGNIVTYSIGKTSRDATSADKENHTETTQQNTSCPIGTPTSQGCEIGPNDLSERSLQGLQSKFHTYAQLSKSVDLPGKISTCIKDTDTRNFDTLLDRGSEASNTGAPTIDEIIKGLSVGKTPTGLKKSRRDDESLVTFNNGGLLRRCEKMHTTNWTEIALNDTPNKWNNSFKAYVKNSLAKNVSISEDEVELLKSLQEKHAYYSQLLALEQQGSPKLCSWTSNQTGTPKQVSLLLSQEALETIKEVKREIAQKIAASAREAINIRKSLELCESMVGLTNRTFGVIENTKAGQKIQETPPTNRPISYSMDGKVQCFSSKYNTQDFPACHQMVSAYNAMAVAKVGMQQVQGIQHQAKGMEEQASLQSGSLTGDHNAALKAQKNMIGNMKNIANQRAAFDTAKAATFFSIVQKMPKTKDILASCQERSAGPVNESLNKELEKVGEKLSTLARGLNVTSELEELKNEDEELREVLSETSLGSKSFYGEDHDACEIAFAEEASTLLKNTAARQVATQLIAQAATEAGVNIMKAGILGKQVKSLDSLMQEIDDIEPDFQGGGFENLNATECQMNPSAEGCLAEGTTPRDVGFGSNGISFSAPSQVVGGTRVETDEFGNPIESDGSNPSGIDNKDGFVPLGGLARSVNKSGGPANTAGAGKMQKGSGGGGAGGGGAGGGGGGGGVSALGQAQKGARGSGGRRAPSSFSGKYSAGSKYAGYGGGGGRRKKSRKGSNANPFSKMFGKKKKAASSLSFRNPAGVSDKSGNLFSRISKRYKVVNKKGRLLEYKLK